jgi:hypothetical protein
MQHEVAQKICSKITVLNGHDLVVSLLKVCSVSRLPIHRHIQVVFPSRQSLVNREPCGGRTNSLFSPLYCVLKVIRALIIGRSNSLPLNIMSTTPFDPVAQTTAEDVVWELPEENGDALTFFFPLEVDGIRSNELGGRATPDWSRSLFRERSSDWTAPSKDDDPRKEDFTHQLDVIESRPAKLHFRVSLQVIEFGSGGNSNSHHCLLVFNFSIHNISPRERFSKVSIGIEFRDADPDKSCGSSHSN